MITKTKQDWSIGKTVKVGFMELTVLAVNSYKDSMPDIYTLQGKNGKKHEFIPHNGLFEI
jgi:hypothetical protein